jgi:hypothetical protein
VALNYIEGITTNSWFLVYINKKMYFYVYMYTHTHTHTHTHTLPSSVYRVSLTMTCLVPNTLSNQIFVFTAVGPGLLGEMVEARPSKEKVPYEAEISCCSKKQGQGTREKCQTETGRGSHWLIWDNLSIQIKTIQHS